MSLARSPSCLIGLALALLSACGSVRHATRPGPTPASQDPTFVEVRTTGLDSPYAIVSWSTWDVDKVESLPAEAPADVVRDMRAHAAERGAERLLIERVEDAWRKAWIGLGVVRAESPTEVAACEHAAYAAARRDAIRRAQTCVKRLLFERPQLAGRVEVLLELDPHGRTLRAAPTPDSSRDGQLQACVLGAVHATDFGAPAGWTCKGRVAVSTDGLDP